MTDNSYELFHPPYLNNPKSCPKNMNAYLPKVLSETQQSKTDNAKIKMARHNQKYLGAHPEIKAIVSLILRNLFIHRPVNIHEWVGGFVKREQFPDEIAQFLVEELNVQFSEEEDEEDLKAPESAETTHDPRLGDIHHKTSAGADHRFLKRMLYGADPHSLRHSQEQHESSHVALSYDQLLKMMRSSSACISHISHNSEDTAVAGAFKSSDLEDEEEEEEEVASDETLEDNRDNEEALLEGQRLIFAMLGKKLTPSPSTSDISMPSMNAGRKKKHKTSLFGRAEDGSPTASGARVSIYSTFEASPGDDIRPEDEEEDEEYFDKD